jgi:hypothetical protein
VIEIICKAPSHKKERPAIVRRFHYWPDQGWGTEVIKGPRPRYRLAGQALDRNSRPVSRPISRGEVDRVRYRLDCKLCGDVIVVRDDKLYPVFDKFRAHLSEDDYIVITLDMLRRALAANL